MDAKRTAVLARIESLEESIKRAREYLDSGKNAHWNGFRPFFVPKVRDGKELPPHKDWVKNVFLRDKMKLLTRAEKLLRKLDTPEHIRRRGTCRVAGTKRSAP